MDFRWLSLHVLRPIKIVTKTARKHHSMVGLMMWNPIDIPCFPIESHRYPPLYIYIHIYIYVHGCYIQYPIIHIIWSWNHHIPWFISFTMFHYYPIINVKYPNVISRRYPVDVATRLFFSSDLLDLDLDLDFFRRLRDLEALGKSARGWNGA
jgi:hypothetical protein